jgi:hypothetical protein
MGVCESFWQHACTMLKPGCLAACFVLYSQLRFWGAVPSQDEANVYLVMEKCHGWTLEQLLKVGLQMLLAVAVE